MDWVIGNPAGEAARGGGVYSRNTCRRQGAATQHFGDNGNDAAGGFC
jgi:hypothetical protein